MSVCIILTHSFHIFLKAQPGSFLMFDSYDFAKWFSSCFIYNATGQIMWADKTKVYMYKIGIIIITNNDN